MKSILHILILLIVGIVVVGCSTVPPKSALIGTWEPIPSFYRNQQEKQKSSDAGYYSLFAPRVYFHFIEENGSIYIEITTNASPRRERQWVVVSKNDKLTGVPVTSEPTPEILIDIDQASIIFRYPGGRSIQLSRTTEPNQTPEPTPTSITPDAGASVAP